MKVMFKAIEDILSIDKFKNSPEEDATNFTEMWILNKNEIFEVDEGHNDNYFITVKEPNDKTYQGYFDIEIFQPALKGKLDKILEA
jgi:hypothetical protein